MPTAPSHSVTTLDRPVARPGRRSAAAPAVAGESPRTGRLTRWVVALSCLFLATQISPLWYASRDGVSYLSIARSLAHGEGPTNLGREQLFFAPGYSLLVTPLFWLSERPFIWLALLNAGLGMAMLFLSKRWFERQGCADAGVLAALCVVNAAIGILLRRTFSEALFMPLVMLTALAMERLRADSRGKHRHAKALAVGLLFAALCLTRQAGAMLGPGFAIAVAMSVKRRDVPMGRAIVTLLLVAAPAAAVVLALGAYERSVAADARTYTDFFAGQDATWWGQLAEGVRLRINEVGRIVLPGMVKASGEFAGVKIVNFVLYTLACGAIAVGWWRSVRATQDTLLWATPFYLGLYLVWPFDEGIRFLAPWAPVWFLGAYRALPASALLRRRVVTIGWTLHLLVAIGYWLGDDLPRVRRENASWQEIRRLAEQMDSHAERVGWLPKKTDRQRVLLQFELDRPVRDLAPAQSAVAEDLEWLVSELNTAAPPGFELRLTGSEFSLWRRGR